MSYKILFFSLSFVLLTGCQKVENNQLSLESDKTKLDSKNFFFKNNYKKFNFPIDSKSLLKNGKWVDLDSYSSDVRDLKLFYSGDDEATILSTTEKNIGDKLYLLALIAVNYNNYEGSGPAQVLFLSGGEANKEDYKNTLFIPIGGFFPMSENNFREFSEIENSPIKDYCIQSFVLNNDLNKKEEMQCVGQDPNYEIKELKFNSKNLGYEEILFAKKDS